MKGVAECQTKDTFGGGASRWSLFKWARLTVVEFRTGFTPFSEFSCWLMPHIFTFTTFSSLVFFHFRFNVIFFQPMPRISSEILCVKDSVLCRTWRRVHIGPWAAFDDAESFALDFKKSPDVLLWSCRYLYLNLLRTCLRHKNLFFWAQWCQWGKHTIVCLCSTNQILVHVHTQAKLKLEVGGA